MRQILAASILSADFTNLGSQIHQAEDAGVDWIHVDVMDGRFVPNITMGPFIVEACRRITQLPIDVHLMIIEPEKYLNDFADAGASHLTVQIEASPHIHRTLQHIRSLGVRPGVALNPGTPAESISQVLTLVDIALVMSVNPGFSGQVFIPGVLPKTRQLHEQLLAANPQAIIEMDGGLTPDTLQDAARAGVEAFVAATSIFRHSQGVAAGVKSLRSAISI